MKLGLPRKKNVGELTRIQILKIAQQILSNSSQNICEGLKSLAQCGDANFTDVLLKKWDESENTQLSSRLKRLSIVKKGVEKQINR